MPTVPEAALRIERFVLIGLATAPVAIRNAGTQLRFQAGD